MKEFHFFEAAWAEILEHLLKAPDAGKIKQRPYSRSYRGMHHQLAVVCAMGFTFRV